LEMRNWNKTGYYISNGGYVMQFKKPVGHGENSMHGIGINRAFHTTG